MRSNRVYKVMNRPLTILGAERRLFFVALLSGAGVFNLLHSLMGGILLFIVGLIAAQQATKFDTEILRVLLDSTRREVVMSSPEKSFMRSIVSEMRSPAR